MKITQKPWFAHVLAIGIFLLVAVLYCRPALEGKVLQQHDWIQWTGMSKDAENYKTKHGVYPQWTQGIFSGMPSYQIAFNSNARVGWLLPEVLGLFLPNPIKYFFLACICFYLLTVVLRLRPWVGILGALAFAYATYDPVIISVGHHTKMISIALMPGVLAGLMLITQKKYWLGAGFLALFMTSIMAMNHMQIAYYLLIIMAALGISYAIVWVAQKEFKHLLLSLLFAVIGLSVGVFSTAVQLFTTYEYAQRTIRGGSALAETASNSSVKPGKIGKSGLDSAYAMSYSMSIPEPLVLAVPRLFGGSNSDPLPEDGKLAEVFGQYQGLAQQFPANAYWGGIGATSGPPYSGAIICFLAIFAFFVVDNQNRWWILGAISLAILLSWGGYFYGFNGFLLKHLPFYDKFRAPSMAIVIPQLLLPLLAVLGLQQLSIKDFDLKKQLPAIKAGLIAIAVFSLLLLSFYFTADFTSGYEKEMLKQVNSLPDAQTKEVYKAAFKALAEDRQGIALKDILRSLALAAAAGAVVWLMVRKTLPTIWSGVILTVLVFSDLIVIDSIYLNSDSYSEKAEQNGNTYVDAELIPTPVNLMIQQDTSVYRVFDARQQKTVNGQRRGVDPFSDASQAFHHRMINGYHAAKLSIYQDLIENQISKGNQRVFNMLNTKYFIINDSRGNDSAAGNPDAMGPAWLVKGIQFVQGARAEMNALDSLPVNDSAVVDASFKAAIPALPIWDSSASIRVSSYDNDDIAYTVSGAVHPQFAVLSEIYYDAGWEAYADGKRVPIVKTNYVLRGVPLPAGTQRLELHFAPSSYKTGYTVSFILQIVIFLLLGIGIWLGWKNSNKQ